VAAAGVALLLLVVVGLLLVRGLDGDRPEAPDPQPPAPVVRRPVPLARLEEAKLWPEDLAAAGLGKGQRGPEGLTAVLGDARQGGKRFLAVAWSPSGKALAAGGDDGVIRLWHAVQGGQPHVLETGRWILTLAFNRDGSVLASVGLDARVRLLDSATGKQLRILQGHGSQVNCVAWNGDDTLLASGSVDGTVVFWDARRHSLLTTGPAVSGR
jgi:WD40 repeat protein